MAVRVNQPPEDTVTAAQDGLEDLVRSASMIEVEPELVGPGGDVADDELGGARPEAAIDESARLTDAVEAYVLDTTEIDQLDLASATQTGWHFLVRDADETPIGVSETQVVDTASSVEFAGLRSADSARRLAGAIDSLASELGALPSEFEIRFLRVPALGVACLWAHGDEGDDRLSMLTGLGRSASQAIDVTEFLRDVREGLRARSYGDDSELGG